VAECPAPFYKVLCSVACIVGIQLHGWGVLPHILSRSLLPTSCYRIFLIVLMRRELDEFQLPPPDEMRFEQQVLRADRDGLINPEGIALLDQACLAFANARPFGPGRGLPPRCQPVCLSAHRFAWIIARACSTEALPSPLETTGKAWLRA